jgi:hypothetical protein
MKHTQGRPNTTLRTLTPSAKHMQKPQPITREEIVEASNRLTPEECRNIMAKARMMGWAWQRAGVDSQCGDLQGGNG